MKLSEYKNSLENTFKVEISYSKIANILGFSKQYINQIKEKELSNDYLTKLQDYFTNRQEDRIITLDFVNLSPSCGQGTYLYKEAEITPITLGTALIKDVFKISKPHDLKIFKASGDSMEQTIYDNDLLLVNTSIKEYQSSGIYILCKNNEFFCKRLNRLINGNLEIISDNNKYDKEIISKDTDIEIIILGKVIKNLSRGL